MRLSKLTNSVGVEWQSTHLEPLLGCLTEFITDLDTDISREKAIINENKNKNLSGLEAGSSECEDDAVSEDFDKSDYDNAHIWYLEDIKSAAVSSRDRIVEYQLMMIKKITFT